MSRRLTLDTRVLAELPSGQHLGTVVRQAKKATVVGYYVRIDDWNREMFFAAGNVQRIPGGKR